MSLLSNELMRPIKNTAVKVWRRLYAVVSASLWGYGSWIHSLHQFLKSLRSLCLFVTHTSLFYRSAVRTATLELWRFLLRCNGEQVGRSSPFRWKVLPPSSKSNSQPGKNQQESGGKQRPGRWRQCASQIRRWTYTRLHGAVSQMRVLSVTAVRTSNATP